MGKVTVTAGVAVNAAALATEVTVAARVGCSVGDSTITGVGVGSVSFVGLAVKVGGCVISVSMKASTVTTGVRDSVPRGVGVGRCPS